jgi:cytochrome P450
MLGSFVAHGLNQSDAESEVIVQVLAGSDTTATAIRATTLHIITNPRVSPALFSEIHSAGLTSRPWNSIILDAEARNLPYLQAVIKEGLRIHPPAVGLVSKSVPASGDTYKGVYLPPGTKIGNCIWGVMRDKSVWGENADEFRPERWLESKGDKLREMESTLELIFGLGRWQCLGRNVALMELNKVFVELLRRFELVVVKPGEPWNSRSSGLFSQRDFWVRGYRR